jgi:hypothetical protein
VALKNVAIMLYLPLIYVEEAPAGRVSESEINPGRNKAASPVFRIEECWRIVRGSHAKFTPVGAG